MDHGSAAAASVLATLALFYMIAFCIAGAFVILGIWFYWRIFTKAGYNGAISLVNLVPGIGHLICMVILAFGRWPIEDEVARLNAVPAPPVPAPPGTSVMPTS